MTKQALLYLYTMHVQNISSRNYIAAFNYIQLRTEFLLLASIFFFSNLMRIVITIDLGKRCVLTYIIAQLLGAKCKSLLSFTLTFQTGTMDTVIV